jgi:hypothetical protein
MVRQTKTTICVLAVTILCSSCATNKAQLESPLVPIDNPIRGNFSQNCSISMPVIPSHAVYYDANGDVVTYTLNGVRTALVEDMSLTFHDRLCPAAPSGPGACTPPKAGYCSRSYGGYPVCVPC